MSSGVDIGQAAMALISAEFMAAAKGEHGPTLSEAVAHIDHLSGTKAELLEAVAFLACQVQAYRRIANEDAALAIYNIESIVRTYRSGRA